MRYLIFIIVFTITTTVLFAVDLPFKLHKFNDNISKKDIEVFEDKLQIVIVGKNHGFMSFSITREIIYKVNSSKGVERISDISIPDNFDQIFIPHAPEDRNLSNVYSDLKCNYFKATKIISEIEESLEVDESIEDIRMVMVENNNYGNFKKYNYCISDIRVDDIIKIEYKYEIPFRQNYLRLLSNRIFFNSDIFTDKMEFTLCHNSGLAVQIDYFNNVDPDSIYIVDNYKYYSWTKSNMTGCINEAGSRPYLTLPYVVFSVRPESLVYTVYNSFEDKFIPFYAIYARMREEGHTALNLSINQGVNNTQFYKLRKFIADNTEKIENDSLGYQKLLSIHNKIVEDFEFGNDVDFFKRIDTRESRIGDYIDLKTIRDISRYELYIAISLSLKLPYFTTYVCDNRSGQIGEEYFKTMHESDYLITVLLNNNIPQFIYPKSSRYGYFLNEIPFYFENSYARLVQINDYGDYKSPISEEERYIILPGSSFKDNFRMTNSLVEISIDENTCNFKTRVSLSGQFSTLTRGVYQYNYCDPTINPYYNKKVWQLGDNVKVLSSKVSIKNKEFPFQSEINATYTANDIVHVNNDTIEISLSNWFMHIIHTNLISENRRLDYHSDFPGKDSYVYMIKFDENVKLINPFEKIEIKEKFVDYIISVEQISPNMIKIVSLFAISDKVNVTNINVLENVFNNIKAIDSTKLILLQE